MSKNKSAAAVAAPVEKNGNDRTNGNSVVAGELRRVRHDAVTPSKTVVNPRKNFALEEIMGSIREHGILNPLLVRPLPKFKLIEPDMEKNMFRVMKETAPGQWEQIEEWPDYASGPAKMSFDTWSKHEYELIAGERRWRAAGQLELAEVPVLVRAMTDLEAWEIQQAENLSRADLTPLEEAAAFQDAIERKLYGDSIKSNVAALCEKFGKSRSHVYGRLALLKLSPLVREALNKGEIEHCMAVEISKVPGEKNQKELLKIVQNPHREVSVRELRRHIEREFMRALEKPPFDPEEEMVGGALGKEDKTLPVCASCPRRTGNMLEAYPDLKDRPNVCTNPECFETKQRLTAAVKLEKARKAGHNVIEPGSAVYADMFRYGSYPQSNDYIDANSTCYDDPKNRTYGELLKKAGVKPVVTVAPAGHKVNLLARKELPELLKQAGFNFKGERSEESAKAKKEREFKQRVTDKTALAIVAAAEKEPSTIELMRWLILEKVEYDGWESEVEAILKRRGLGEKSEELPAVLKQLDEAQLGSFYVELHLVGYSEPGHYGERQVADMLKIWPVNTKDIEKQVKCDIDAEEKAAKAKAKQQEPDPRLAKGAKEEKAKKPAKSTKPAKKKGKK